jgi:Dynein heavy chain C-terminal domain
MGGVYISGLYLDGAKWNRKSLVDQDPGILYPAMPAIIFRP